jgi:hypothetical protein
MVTPSQMKVWLWILQRADRGTPLDLDEWTYARALAHGAAVEVREGVHDHAIPEGHMANQAIRGVVCWRFHLASRQT